MTAISTGIIFYVDGLKNLYRNDVDLGQICCDGLSPLEILHKRFKSRGIIAGFVLALPDSDAFQHLAKQAEALGIKVSRFAAEKVIEKPVRLRQQRWDLEDDSGNETWLGAAFAAVVDDQTWETAILIPLTNLLVEPVAVFESLALQRRESFDVCFVEERICGAGWTIFQADLLKGLQRSHEELMWVRGGLAWALRKPLYPFKVGYYHCPRIRPRISVDLRLNSRRASHTYASTVIQGFADADFSYSAWLADSGWEKHYLDFSPSIVNVEPTNKCGGGCFNCANTVMRRPVEILDTSMFSAVAAEFSSHHELRWIFSGMGEPLLHPQLAKIISAARGFSSTLITSLQVLPAPDFPFGDLSHLRISIDALEAEGFARVRPGCNWQNIERFIVFAAELRKAELSRFPELGVTFLRHALNEGQQQAFLNYWKQIVKPVFRENFFRWPFDLPVEAVQWYQIMGESEQSSVQGRTARVDFTPVKRRSCRHALLNTTILADGSVTICQNDFEGRFKMGDLNKNSLTEIWQSSAYRDFRQQHLELNFNADYPCQNCRDWYHQT